MELPFPILDPDDASAYPWAELAARPWAREMASCPQDPEYHGEGDVWTHTVMVCEALAALPAWRELPADERAIVFAACLLHDIAKPICTRVIDGRIRQPGHSLKGDIMARDMLWRADVDPTTREAITALIRYHQVPFFCIDEDDPIRRIAQVSMRARCDHLAQVNRADALGRICAAKERLLDNVELFVELAREQGCLTEAFPFPSDFTRYAYFHSPSRDPRVEAYDDTRCEVVMMAGLPGSGKDRWIAGNVDLPVISLDAIRAEIGAPPTGAPGPVLHLARERAREHLRVAQPFVWNATNLTRDIRGRLIELFVSYNARVRIVYVESPYRTLLKQNREREGDARVPEAVIERMSRRWEIPDPTEAHRVDWVFAG
jgi:predicted kinase